MNTLQRLLSNTAFALIANLVAKSGTGLLFILVGRNLGPTASGVYSLGTTFFTIVFGLSALGLHELFVRQVAPRRGESAHYFVHYLGLRLLSSLLTYLLLLLCLYFILPYSRETGQVILIMSLAAIPEAISDICGALFEAHERMATPALVSLVTSLIKIGGGFWLLRQGRGVIDIAWLMVIAGAVGMLIYLPALFRFFRRAAQPWRVKPDFAFSLGQLRQTPGFFVIYLFSVVDYQADVFLISLLLTETSLGLYSAAMTITLAISLLAFAVRVAIYPVMTRYAATAPDKLALLHHKANQYLIVLALPIAAGVCLLARPMITLIFGETFEPAVPVLQISVWAAVFILITVPNARLMLVSHRQNVSARLTGASMATNVIANLILIPPLGILGAALARVIASATLFLGIHLYVRANLLRSSFLPLLPRPLLATALMVAAMWPARELPMIVTLIIGLIVYAGAALLLGVVPADDLVYWRQALQSGLGERIERG